MCANNSEKKDTPEAARRGKRRRKSQTTIIANPFECLVGASCRPVVLAKQNFIWTGKAAAAAAAEAEIGVEGAIQCGTVK